MTLVDKFGGQGVGHRSQQTDAVKQADAAPRGTEGLGEQAERWWTAPKLLDASSVERASLSSKYKENNCKVKKSEVGSCEFQFGEPSGSRRHTLQNKANLWAVQRMDGPVQGEGRE